MTVKLAVAGAFHTAFMQPARERLQEALAATPISEPRIPVVSNVDAQPHADPAVIKDILAQQLTAPVQWETTLKTLLERGLERSYEIGPNKVLRGGTEGAQGQQAKWGGQPTQQQQGAEARAGVPWLPGCPT